MIALLFALAAMQPTISRDVRGGSVSFPDGVAPHMEPYINCLTNGMHADPRSRTSDPAQLRTVHADALAHCADVRQAAFDDTDRALKNDGAYRGRDRRRAAIEGWLSQIDHLEDGLIDTLAKLNASFSAGPHN